MILLKLLSLKSGGNNPIEMHEIIYLPKLWLHASCKWFYLLVLPNSQVICRQGVGA